MYKAFQGIGLNREKVFITNIWKCRPITNSKLDEYENVCFNYLRNEVILVKPKIIVLLGNIAVKKILGENYDIISSRGKWIEKKGILYMPTWHPLMLLHDECKKLEFWKDLQLVKNRIFE